MTSDDYFSALPAFSLLLAAAFSALLLAGFVMLRKNARREVRSRRDAKALRTEIRQLKEAAAARDRAEAASEAKSRFLATVSHEIRTPLNGILGMADLLGATPLAAEQRSYVEAIRTSGGALASLIDEILDFSRIEAGKLELAAEPFDLVALVEGMVELLAPRAQGKGLEIAASIAADVPRHVVGDGARLRQVLINLAGNAVKFTEAGGIGVRVTRAAGGAIRFAVADTGPGIAPDRRAAIFEEFEQGDGSASRRHGGSGLGLAISMRIVERMGGRLTLENASDQGSIFSFDIALAAARGTAREAEAPSLAGRSALIVGRSPFEAPYLGERLAAAGAAVTRAEGTEAALAALERRPPPDIVIVDCALGETATRQLAGAARAAGVARSLVLFSPFERRAFGQNSLAGFDGWLVKPVRSRSFLARLVGPSPVADSAGIAPDADLAPLPCQNRNVLVAEDNDINALLVERHLQRLGARVTRVHDGMQAVAAAAEAAAGRQQTFDIILMDIRMPGLDGLEAARRIRRDEGQSDLARVRIVALTANAFAEDRAASLAAGIDEFLTKPVDLMQLARAIIGKTAGNAAGWAAGFVIKASADNAVAWRAKVLDSRDHELMWHIGRQDGLTSKILFLPQAAGRKPAIRDLRGLPPSLGRMGSLEVRLATSKKEIRRAQKLRYKIFYEQGQAVPDRKSGLVRRDICPFDRVCDHLLVIDHAASNRFGRTAPRVVGTYRLLRQDVAERNFGFYTAREFDIAPLLARHAGKTFLELGRSCVLPAYRSKRTLELLWRGIWTYVRHHHIDVMIGCASLEGTNPLVHALPLSFLHHHAGADTTWTARARRQLYVRMDFLDRPAVDMRKALAALPPLVKGYLRLGASIGDGAVIDRQFGTTDILVVLPVAAIEERYVAHFGSGGEEQDAA